MSKTDIRAIIWDYDGTLVDTRHKNMNVTRSIIESLIEQDPETFPALQTLENYNLANRRNSNWRELYRSEFNLSERQIDEAGQLWTEHQMNDDTDVTLYKGIDEVIRNLVDFPHGIVSQNSRVNISQYLEKHKLLTLFKYIVGYEEVDLDKQKPDPDGLLNCIEKLSTLEPGLVCYIGDHETDVQCARNANQELMEKNKNISIISIGACYDNGTDTSVWDLQPDYVAANVEDLLDIIEMIRS